MKFIQGVSMRVAVCLGVLACVMSVQAAETTPPVWSEVAARLDEIVPALQEKHHAPGVSIALVENNQNVWAKGYGVRNAGSPEPVDPDTRFEACSMSKPVYAYAVMKLVEDGKLDLDRPLVEYLSHSYLEDEPLHQKITARMVLNHTTGFPNWRPGGWRSDGKLVVKFEPGTQYGYSGEGFTLLQTAVEEIVKEPMEAWMQRVVLQPLEMSQSGYVWRPEFSENSASGHDDKGELKTPRRRYQHANSAFTLYCTPSDYARFLIEMMTADGTASHSLKSETIEAMLTPHYFGETRTRHGLAWSLPDPAEGSYADHSGSNGTGFRCYARFDRKTGAGIVIMTNSVNGTNIWKSIVAEPVVQKMFGLQ